MNTPRPSRRRGAALAAFGAAVWLLCGLRRAPDDGRAVVIDSPLGFLEPRLEEPGWHLAPPGLLRVSRYPLRPVSLALGPADEKPSLLTADGDAVAADLLVRYHVEPDRLLDLHRRLGPGFESGDLRRWAGEALRAAVAEARYADVSGARTDQLQDRIGRALGERFRASGLVLLSCEVGRVRLLQARAPAATPAADAGGRILLVGLDGADWNLIDPLLRAGRLPHLDRLIRSGVRAKLQTISPMLSPVLWTSIATGVLPPRHGILDFVAGTEREGERVPVASTQRKVKAFWNILSEGGLDVGVVGWWATFPAERVRGYVVSDRVAYQLLGVVPVAERDRDGKVFPAEADDRVLAATIAPESITPEDLLGFARPPADDKDLPADEAHLVDGLRTSIASGRTYVASALALEKEFHPRLTAVYLEETDTIAHLFMPYAPPAVPWVKEPLARRYGHAVDGAYEEADALLGRLMEGIQAPIVIVVSDHGFKSGDNRPTTESRPGYGIAADWHRRYGILILSGPPFLKGVEIPDVSLLDVAPTLLRLVGLPVGEDMDGRPVDAAFDSAWLSAHPESYIPSWEKTVIAARPESATSAPAAPSASPSADAEGDRERVERLQSLGYIASGGGENVHNNRGASLLSQRRFDEAIAEFEQAIKGHEDISIARINLARALIERHDLDGARRDIDLLLEKKPRSKDAEFLLGRIAAVEGHSDEAEAAYRRALAFDPHDTEARNALGLLEESRGRHEEALEEFRRVVEVDPDFAEARNNMGAVLRALGRDDEAAEAFRKAIALDPKSPGAYNNLAILLEDRGDYGQAESLLREAMKRAPKEADIHSNLGGLLHLTGRDGDALVELQRATALDPRSASAFNNTGAALERLGRRTEAIAAYRQAVSLDPGSADLHRNLGLALWRGGSPEEGERELRRALASGGTGAAGAVVALGGLLVESGRVQEALDLAAGESARHPADADLKLLLGECARRAGRADQASAAFDAALKLRPGDAAFRRKVEEARGSADKPGTAPAGD
jgi:Flp pilus assembly protein TadD/predicted AlkP superfamily phosphohydrolase/phosphomutase